MKMSEEARIQRIQNSCGTELRCSCVKLGNTCTTSNVKEMLKPVPIIIPHLHSPMKSINETGQSKNVPGSSSEDTSFKNLCSSCSDATGSRTTINASKFQRTSTVFPSKKDFIAIGCTEISFLDKKPMPCPKAGKEPKKKINIFSSKVPHQDTRVSVISSSQLEKWSQSNSKKPPILNKKCLPQDKDFPELSAVLKGLSKSNISRQSLSEIPENEADENSRHGDSKERELSRKSKQPSRKDPISIKLFDIIKKPSPKHFRASSRIHLRSEDKRRLGGNLLDSSNPIRKRGKHREIPAKKKLSKLKCVIYSERKKKRERRELGFEPLNKGSSEVGETPTVESICAQLLPLKIESDCSTNSQEDALVMLSDGNKVGGFEGGLMSNETKTIPRINVDFDEEPEVSNPGPSHASSCISGLSPSTIHSRKFREYCDNLRSKELDEAVTKLLKEIYRFQDRLHQKDPVLALAKRRFVLGIREVKKYLMLRKLKAIVIAPDLEPIQSAGGLDEVVLQIREDGKFQQIPVIFAVGRRQLGFALKKKVPISAIGIINPEGAEELYQCMLETWRTATVQYQKKCNM